LLSSALLIIITTCRGLGTCAPRVPRITPLSLFEATVHAPGLNSTQQSRVPVTAKAGRGRSTRRAPGPLSYASSLTCRTTAHASFVTAGSRSHPHARSLTQAHIQSCHGVWKFHSNKKNWILWIPLNFIKFNKI
jgi:hypothetical protein